MISDTLHDAICEIEDYQRNMPDVYGDLTEAIDAVKKVMAALMDYLDHPPFQYPLDVAQTLSADQKEWWQTTCEANIARWAERLRLLGPVSPEEIMGTLDDAIKRQEALLQEPTNTKDDLRREDVDDCAHQFLSRLRHLLYHDPELKSISSQSQ